MAPSAHALGLRQNHTYVSNSSHTKQAQLANAYSSLAEELSTDHLKVVGGYTLGKVIGEGTFGSVHIASHRLTGMRCAIKKVEKTATPQLTREIHHHRRLHHPHIVHLHEIIATENHIWLVFELCSGGELFDYLVERGRILEGEARRLFGELCTAVGWLHRQGIVHRDLKLENVLLDGELRVKLADLGFAREYQKGRLMETFCGTTGYASPEMLSCQKYTGVETDVWSLGIILYTLLCGGLPFDDDDERVMKDLIIKGEYEEPEWLTEEARSLIRGMLQKNPSDRLSMESILTHPWFKTTLYDNIQNAASALSIPPSNPSSPIVHAVASSDNITRKRLSTSSAASFPFCPRASTSQIQLLPESKQLATSPEGESEPSETSFEFSDNAHGKPTTSGDTSPTTAENEDEPDSERSPSGEFSKAERALELAHKNSSESTIRKTDQLRERLARMSLEGQREDLESDVSSRETSRGDKRLSASSLPMIDELSLTLPVADHSRTPVRTKRRSLTSQLPLERKLSHHSVSSQWQAFVPDDYLALVNADLPPLFSTPSEKLLLDRLSSLGFDMGQLMHSVKTDACDSSSAMWWLLRLKQLERGETDDAVQAKKERERRRKERAKRKRDEKEQAAASAMLKGTPTAAVDPSVVRTSELLSTPRTIVTQDERPLSGHSVHSARSSHATTASNHTHSTHQERAGSPPPGIPTIVAPSPTAEQSPSKETRKSGRSQSINMLQRATSMLIPGIRKTDADHHAPNDKPCSEHKEHQHRDPTPEPPDSIHRIDSPTKLTHKLSVPTMPKMTKSESDPLMLNNVAGGTPTGENQLQAPELSPPRAKSFHAASLENAEAGPSNHHHTADSESKAPKKDSIWTQFRYLFNEDRRRRKREGPTGNKTPQVIPTRSSRPGMGRTTLPPPSASRRTSFDGSSRPMFSHRSSSVNSRRSSMSNVVSPDFTINLNDGLYHTSLGRRASGRSARSFRSTGTETPTSDREGPSRAGSVHSRRGGSRRSSIRSPTMSSDGRIRMAPPSSPLHDYHRRSASGTASTRVRHIRVLHEAKSIRPASVASSTRSNASSRASSIIGREEDSDDDIALRRSISDEHRVRSPLSATAPIGRGKPPLRDVFSKKSDEEWESEDDEYACGLGQGNPSKSKSYGGYQTKWSGATVRPGATAPASYGHEHSGGTPTASRFVAGKKKSVGGGGGASAGTGADAPDHATSTSAQQQSSSGSGSRNTGRRGLPAARAAAPAQIIEEEEEEEEE